MPDTFRIYQSERISPNLVTITSSLMGLAKIVFKNYSALESKRLVRHIGIGLQLLCFY